MAFKVIAFESTPNPNALKVVLDRSPGPEPRSYRLPPDSTDDPLGSALMAIPGVHNILIHDGWIAVGKTPDATWPPIKAEIRRVLRDAAEP
ncbi:MAG: NifU N-terminal domain-containing protein [Phycisphaeraceae bacterium]|nr:NifU N-terminal domain-containing protein [Phycisphaeraceae bacterium]MCW5754757.1 NifU N-terminal domain-containing protein [Phycisphaeraceae bacterium]